MRKVVNAIRAGVENIALLAGATAMTLGGKASVAKALEAGDVSSIPVDDNLDLMELVTKIINFILYAVGVIAVVYLIYGGIQYVTAGGDAEKATKGRTTITNAIIGIIIIMASLVIYNFVIGKGSGGGLFG